MTTKVSGAMIESLPAVVTTDITDAAVTATKLAATLDLSAKTITLPATSVTAAMLSAVLDLSGKTITLPATSVTAPMLAATLDLSGKTVTLPATAIGMGVPHIMLENQQTSGTNGGAFNSGADRTCPLTTEVRDVRSECALASNQFVLTAGTYWIEAVGPGYRVDLFQYFLYNVTGAAELLRGTSAKSDNASDLTPGYSFLEGSFTVAAAQTLELRGRCGTTSASGFGQPTSLGQERYARVKLWRLA